MRPRAEVSRMPSVSRFQDSRISHLKKSAAPGSQGRRWRLAFFKAREKSSDRHDFHTDAHSQEAAERSGIGTANRHHTAWMRANAGSDMLLGGSLAQSRIASEPAVLGKINLRPRVGRRVGFRTRRRYPNSRLRNDSQALDFARFQVEVWPCLGRNPIGVGAFQRGLHATVRAAPIAD